MKTRKMNDLIGIDETMYGPAGMGIGTEKDSDCIPEVGDRFLAPNGKTLECTAIRYQSSHNAVVLTVTDGSGKTEDTPWVRIYKAIKAGMVTVQ